MRMSVVPEQARRMIARNLNRVMQDLHVHAGIHCASLPGLGRKIVDVGNSENVTRGSTNDGSHRPTVECEGIPAIFIHCVQRKGYNVILRSYLRRVRQKNSLGVTQSCEKYLRSDKE